MAKKLDTDVETLKFIKREKKFLPKCPVQFKTSYSEEVAKKEAVRLGKKTVKLRAYRCEFCSFWHLTHQRRYK